MADAEPGTFYLTDFLLRHFERLVIDGLGIDRHPELADEYFRQLPPAWSTSRRSKDPQLAHARRGDIAQQFGLEFEQRFTGYGDLATSLRP